MENFFRQFEQMSDAQIAVLIAVAVIVSLVLAVLVAFLTTVGRIGLYRGTMQADQGAASLSFGELFSGSLPYFWRVFFLNLLIGLGILLVALLIAGLVILGTVVTFGLMLICLIPLVCLIVPFGWLVGVWIEQANIAIVVENLGIVDGLKRGWQVFRDNIGTMIVMGLILIIGVGMIGGFIIGIPLFAILIPALAGVFIGTENALGGGLLVAGLCFVAYLPVLLVLGGILHGYIESAWTLTYLRVTGKSVALEPVSEPAG